MTAAEVLEYVVLKANLDPQQNWGLFEVICNKELGKSWDFSPPVLLNL